MKGGWISMNLPACPAGLPPFIRTLCIWATRAGRCWDMRQHISSLVTLGTPHLSLEQYPFGRVEVGGCH
jgi:hypothetical protein